MTTDRMALTDLAPIALLGVALVVHAVAIHRLEQRVTGAELFLTSHLYHHDKEPL